MLELICINIIHKAAAYFFNAMFGKKSLTLICGIHYYVNVRICFLIVKCSIPFQICHINFRLLRYVWYLPLYQLAPRCQVIVAHFLSIVPAERNNVSPHVPFMLRDFLCNLFQRYRFISL